MCCIAFVILFKMSEFCGCSVTLVLLCGDMYDYPLRLTSFFAILCVVVGAVGRCPKIRAVTDIFRNTNIKIAFKTADTTQKIIRPHRQNPTSAYEKSGVYKLTCKTCKKAYVGQTSRNLRARHQEHTRYIKNNDPRSAYALHILNNKHEYGTMEETMTLLRSIDKQTLLLPTEQLYIQTLHDNNELIPEQIPNEPNPLSELLQTPHL